MGIELTAEDCCCSCGEGSTKQFENAYNAMSVKNSAFFHNNPGKKTILSPQSNEEIPIPMYEASRFVSCEEIVPRRNTKTPQAS